MDVEVTALFFLLLDGLKIAYLRPGALSLELERDLCATCAT